MTLTHQSILICLLFCLGLQNDACTKNKKSKYILNKDFNNHQNSQESRENEDDDDYFTEVDDEEEKAQKQQKLYFLYLKASYLHARGKVKEATATYQSLLEHNPPSYVYDGYLTLLFDMGQFQAIIGLVEKKEAPIQRILKHNLDLQLIVAQSYIHVNQDQKAGIMLTKLAKEHPDNVQIAYYAAVALLKGNQAAKATEFIDTCLANQSLQSKHFLFYFLKSKIYLAQQNLPQALSCIEKSLEKFPKFDRGWLLKGMLMEQQGKVTEAISGYKSFLDIVGRDAMVEKQLIQLLFSQKRFSEAADYLKKIKSESPEYFFDLALIQHKGNDFGAAYSNIKKALKLNPDFKQARLLAVDILFAQQKYDHVLSFMRKWIARTPQDDVALHTLLILRKSPIGAEKIIALLEGLIKDKQHSSTVIIALADLYTDTENYSRAIHCYEKLADMTTDNQMKANILYQLGYLYHQTKQPEKVEQALKESLELDSSSASASNLLAYHYAQTGKNLDQALELIDKALHQNPQSSYYLDTKGCILLKLGRKDEAVQALQQANSLSPNDSTIQQHLATAHNGV